MRRRSDREGRVSAPPAQSPGGLTLLGRLRLRPSLHGPLQKPEDAAKAAPGTPRAPSAPPQRVQTSPSDGLSRTVSCSSTPQKKDPRRKSREGRRLVPRRVEVWSSTASGWTEATLVALDRRAGSDDVITVEFEVPGVGRCGKRLYATSDRVRMAPLEEEDDDPLTHTKTNAATCGIDEGSGAEGAKGQLVRQGAQARDSPDDALEALDTSLLKRRPSHARRKSAASCTRADLQAKGGASLSLPGLDTVVLGDKLGAGSFGVVYAGEIKATARQVAVKFEPADVRVPQLEAEADVLRALQGDACVAGLHWYGCEGDYNVMVMDLLGCSLEDVFEGNCRLFSPVRVAKLAVQMVACVRHLHSRGFLHRDIKPSNFTLGCGREASQVRIIDFGLAKPFRSSKGHHYPPATGVSFVGTLRYASIRAHLRQEQSRRDDMHSLGYVFAYFLRGRLPWQGIDAPSKEERREEILRAKQSANPPQLFDGQPRQFALYMYKVFELGHFQEPPYDSLEGLLREVVDERDGPTT